MHEHIGAYLAILNAVCAGVVWHAGAIAFCLLATTRITGTLDLALLEERVVMMGMHEDLNGEYNVNMIRWRS